MAGFFDKLSIPENEQVHWLYVDMNSFFASCEQHANPLLRKKCVAVVPMMADTTFCIAASYEAKAYGVKTGTRVADAKAMCPNLILVTAHHDRYVRVHHQLIEAIESCLPVHAVCSIDEVACELTGWHKNPVAAKKIAEQIKQTIYEKIGEALTCSIGLGPNMLLAKMAADMKKPNGLTTITRAEMPDKLFSLKLQDVPGIGRRMEDRLIRQGIDSMKTLLLSDEKKLREIWGGVVGSRMYKLLQGEPLSSPAYFSISSAPKSIGHEHVLPPKERNRKDAILVMQRLLTKAAVRLRKAQRLTRCLTVRMRLRDKQYLEKSVHFEQTQDTAFLLKTLSDLLMKHKWEAPFKVGITLSHFVDEAEQQFLLFNDGRRDQLFKIVDKLNTQYGLNKVYVGSLHNHLGSAPTRIAFSRIPDLDELVPDDFMD